MELVLRALMDNESRVMAGAGNVRWINAMRFNDLPMRKIRDIMHGIFQETKRDAEITGDVLLPNSNLETLSDDVINMLPDPRYDYGAIDYLLKAITEFLRNSGRLARNSGVAPQRRPNAGYAVYDPNKHGTLLRYGVVELRVLENFLLDRDGQLSALEQLMPHLQDEERMYAPSRASGFLESDDYEWNLKRLMTNAGFYVESEIGSAWQTLEEWAERYLQAIRNANLVWHNGCLPYYLKIELNTYRSQTITPSYVNTPSIFQIYDAFQGNEVLIVTPLAELVRQQIESGRIRRLYDGYIVPEFSLRAVSAWVSTWPNRPHSDWRETYFRLCEAVQAAHRERPFTVFAAACGCYGLPLCDFVQQQIGCKVLYLGNSIHAAFGIRQRATRDFMSQRVNHEMWVESDLAKYKNMDRIDKGRYIW